MDGIEDADEVKEHDSHSVKCPQVCVGSVKVDYGINNDFLVCKLGPGSLSP